MLTVAVTRDSFTDEYDLQLWIRRYVELFGAKQELDISWAVIPSLWSSTAERNCSSPPAMFAPGRTHGVLLRPDLRKRSSISPRAFSIYPAFCV